ncbi:hypothetical protein BKA62DRAFT_753170 [Auriculariales sp. MPI-PUGE-AT-0066]|nr:hypothetical protein BKA62DRAFT_753170 [Auriculariales sp. MPI-PUGE-AT-0066]
MLLAIAALALPLAVASASVTARDSGYPRDRKFQAWVRAEDLVQNSIAHGELRLRLLDEEDAKGISLVGLRLQLDEFLEHFVIPDRTGVPDWLWQDHLAVTTTTVQNSSHFVSTTEWTLASDELSSLNSMEGLVIPFSVAVPDVRYPCGIHPLVSECSNGIIQATIGRGYVYTAFVRYANGTQASTPAGFTSFIPRNDDPSEPTTTTLALQRLEPYGRFDSCSFELPDTLSIKLAFPNGVVTIPGSDLIFDISLEVDTPSTTTDMIISLQLYDQVQPYVSTSRGGNISCYRDISPLTAPSSHISGSFNHNFVRVSSVPTTIHLPIEKSILQQARDRYFAVEPVFTLQFEAIRQWNTTAVYPHSDAAHFTQDHPEHSVVAEGWAYDECNSEYRTRSNYRVASPLTIPVTRYAGRDYLDRSSNLPAPKLVHGHIEGTSHDYPLATLDEHEVVVQGLREHNPMFEVPKHHLEGFVGQYSGSIWAKRQQSKHVVSQVLVSPLQSPYMLHGFPNIGMVSSQHYLILRFCTGILMADSSDRHSDIGAASAPALQPTFLRRLKVARDAGPIVLLLLRRLSSRLSQPAHNIPVLRQSAPPSSRAALKQARSKTCGHCTIGFVALALAFASNAQTAGVTTRYWDCCKPSCGWTGKASVNQPALSCDKGGSKLTDFTIKNGCESGGTAFTCIDNQPWAINSTLAYGFAAVAISGSSEAAWCCECYELTFTSGAVSGQKMVVQATNTGGDLGSNHFDLLMPGGGVGIFNGCTSQFGSWNGGAQYGGVSSRSECDNLPSSVRNGCYWRFDWFKGADNPSITFKKTTCPSELIAKSGCKRNDAAPPTTLTSSSVSSTSSSSSSSSSTTTTTTTTSGSGGTAPQWGQCGGIGYTGATTCASGYTCHYVNDYYSQCY